MVQNKIQTTTDDYDELAGIVDKTRPSSEEIKVPRALFLKLFFDHATLTEMLEKANERQGRKNSGTAGDDK